MDYSHTIIYKICCKDVSINDIYVGHTTNFIQRKNQHKTSSYNINDKKYNQYVYKFIRENGGWDNWSMIQLEKYNCKNRREAEAREYFWIQQLNSTLNTNTLLNSTFNTDAFSTRFINASTLNTSSIVLNFRALSFSCNSSPSLLFISSSDKTL